MPLINLVLHLLVNLTVILTFLMPPDVMGLDAVDAHVHLLHL